jgi:hypothetical protein
MVTSNNRMGPAAPAKCHRPYRQRVSDAASSSFIVSAAEKSSCQEKGQLVFACPQSIRLDQARVGCLSDTHLPRRADTDC